MFSAKFTKMLTTYRHGCQLLIEQKQNLVEQNEIFHFLVRFSYLFFSSQMQGIREQQTTLNYAVIIKTHNKTCFFKRELKQHT